MENLPVCMIRRNLKAIPQYSMPAGFRTRLFRPGDDVTWVVINAAADKFNKITAETFQREFKGDIASLRTRCFFLCTDDGRDIGTATAWYNPNFHGQPFGRIHWVAIVPEFQGKGLAKPMMTVAMNRMVELHERAYLATSTARIVAIKVYLDFGFVPDIAAHDDVKAWELVRRHLNHPLLRAPSLWHTWD